MSLYIQDMQTKLDRHNCCHCHKHDGCRAAPEKIKSLCIFLYLWNVREFVTRINPNKSVLTTRSAKRG